MPVTLDIDRLDFSSLVKPGDAVLWGQSSAEPLSLTRELLAQRHRIGGFSVFLGIPASDTVQPEQLDCVEFSAYCGAGVNRKLAALGGLDVLPCHYSQLPEMIRRRQWPVDVLLLQLSPPDADGFCSYGTAVEYLEAAVAAARVVIAEINDQVPVTGGHRGVHIDDIHHVVATSRPVLELPASPPGEIEQAVARQVAQLIDDGDTLQMGIGSLPEAILGQLRDHRDLGIHSGTIGDAVADLMEAGVITNRRKSLDAGYTVAGILMGTRRLYDFAHRNPQIQLKPTTYTHDHRVLGGQHRLATINAALEVDLTGQINAEEVSGRYLGAVGGALDFIRGAHAATGGKPITVLTSMAGGHSRIVSRLSGPVSTPRSDAGIIVTEHGAADLRGLTLSRRIERMIAIAHPEARSRLEQEAAHIIGTRSGHTRTSNTEQETP